VPVGADPDDRGFLEVTRSCRIPVAELTWRFTTSGGPGGQHANRNRTAAEVSFDVAGSPSLGPRQRSRIIDRLGEVVRASASEERSQLRNRALAQDRLRERLALALRIERPRVATAPSRAARERRLQEKRLRSRRKKERRIEPD
jgi:ribosome-associated protein